MREILERLFDMLLNVYMVLSSRYASKYIDRVISDEKSLIRYWFYTSIAVEERYDNPPQGDILDIVDDWLNTLYGNGEDRTGLVDEFHGDKDLLLDYLEGWVEDSQKKYRERSDRFFELWLESLEGGEVPKGSGRKRI